MYDFCFTPIYATLLILGGLLGFLMKGSVVSLAGGAGSAVLLLGLTYTSFQYYKKQQACKPAVAGSLVISLGLAVHMYQRFAATQKAYTAVVAFVSGLMAAYYVWNLTMFKPHYKVTKKSK